MAGFDAAKAVEALEYDFTTLKRPDGTHYAGKGTVPEPSQAEINALFDSMRAAITNVGIEVEDMSSEQSITKAMARASSEQLEAVTTLTKDAVIEICSGSPSREEYEALPGRHQQAFQGWLLGNLTNPTTPDTRP